MCKREWTAQHYLLVSQAVLTLSLKMEANVAPLHMLLTKQLGGMVAMCIFQWYLNYQFQQILIWFSVSVCLLNNQTNSLYTFIC